MPARFRLLAVGTAGAVLLASGATAGVAAGSPSPSARPSVASSAAAPSAAASTFRLPVTGKLLTPSGRQVGTVTGHVIRMTSTGRTLSAVTAMTVRTPSGTFSLTRNVPVTGMNNNAAAAGAASPAVVSCSILHLVLGPLDLNLLGLRIQLNQVILDITAVPGAGQLLGNLLCSIANLFNAGGFLSNVSVLLNQVLAILTQITGGA